MPAETTEQKLKNLEKKMAILEREVERAKAVGEIQNLINRLQYYHSIGKNSEMHKKIFAQKAKDVRLHFGENGYWEGLEGITIIDNMEMGGPPRSRKGRMAMHLMLQPIIEVAGDGKTARATFWAMGLMAGKDRKTGEPSATWEWNRYGDDFIKEDGKWKLWHHHVYPLFVIGYDQNWADQFKKKKEEMGGMHFPDAATKYHHPPSPQDVFYNPEEELPEIPPPEPYETWDPKLDTFK